MIETGLAES